MRALKPLFVDRDGVINRFPGKGAYVVRPENFEFIPGALEALRVLTQAGFELFVISNQGCVARELITLEELRGMTDLMLADIQKAGGAIAGVHYCYHRKADNCECKKPKTALFKKALEGRVYDPAGLYFIGDSAEDIQAGQAFGCQTVLVLSGRTTDADVDALPSKPDFIKKDLLEAAQWLVARS